MLINDPLANKVSFVGKNVTFLARNEIGLSSTVAQ